MADEPEFLKVARQTAMQMLSRPVAQLTPAMQPGPHGGAEFGGSTNMGTAGNVDRQKQIAGRGQADFSIGNIMNAGLFAGSLMSGTGPIMLGAKLAAHQIAPGLVDSPMPKFTGSKVLSAAYKNQIGGKFKTAAEAFDAQTRDRALRNSALTASRRASFARNAAAMRARAANDPGGGQFGGGLGSNTPSGKDKPGPGGKVR